MENRKTFKPNVQLISLILDDVKDKGKNVIIRLKNSNQKYDICLIEQDDENVIIHIDDFEL